MAEDEARQGQHEPERHEPGAPHGAPPPGKSKGGKLKTWVDDHKLAVIGVLIGVVGIAVTIWLRSRSSSSSATTTTPSGATQGSTAPGSSGGGGGGTWWPGTGAGATSNPGSQAPNVTVNVPSQPAPVVNLNVAGSTGGGSSGAPGAKKVLRTPTTPASLLAAAPPPVSLPTTGVVPNLVTQTPGNIGTLVETPTNQLAEVASIGGYSAGAPGARVGRVTTVPVQLPNTSTSLATVNAATASAGLGTGPGKSVVTQSKSPAKSTTSRAHALAGQTSLTQSQALQI